VYVSWGTWITDCDNTDWNSEKINKEHIMILREQLIDTYESIKRRYDEGNNGHLEKILLVIGTLGGHMDEAIEELKRMQEKMERWLKLKVQWNNTQIWHQLGQPSLSENDEPLLLEQVKRQVTPWVSHPPQTQQPHEKATESTVDENMHEDNAEHQAHKPAGMPSHTAPPPMATFMANSEAETPHQSNLDKGKQNHLAPTAESAPNTPGLGPPARRLANPIARNMTVRPLTTSQQKANQQQAQPEPEPTQSFNDAKNLGWDDDDIYAEKRRPLLKNEEFNNIAKLALVKAWLEQNNHKIVDAFLDTLEKRQQAPEFVGKTDFEQYKLMLGTGVYQLFFDKITNRYKQLRQYATVRRSPRVYDWQVDIISLEDIRKQNLKALVAKDMEFLNKLKDVVPKPAKQEDLGYIEVYREAHLNVEVMYLSIESITAPLGTAAPISGSLPGAVAPPTLYQVHPQVPNPVQPYPTGPPGKEPSKGRPIGLTGTSQWG
jgi:hypothetical protein